MLRFIALMCVSFGITYAAEVADLQHIRLLQLKIENNFLKQELLRSQVQHSAQCDSLLVERSPRNSDRVIRLAWKNVGLTDESIYSCRMQIASKITAEEDAKDYWWIDLDLSTNYITSKGFKELADFITDDSDMRSHLLRIDLSNNRIGDEGVDYVKKILEKCSYVNVLININNVDYFDVVKVFSSDSDKVLLKRLTWENNA